MKYLQQCKNLIFIWLISAVGLMAQSPVLNYTFSGDARDEVNGAAAQTNAASLTQDRFGNAGSAMEFDGEQTTLTTPSIAALNTAHTTVTLWTKDN